MLGRVALGSAVGVAVVVAWASVGFAESPAQRGYRLLTNSPLLPPDFDQETFDAAWQSWPTALRAKMETASAQQRSKLAFSRYGLTPRKEDPSKPLQYVVDDKGQWTMNCFACHGGKVAGRAIPGLPNSLFALQTLMEETRAVKPRLGKRLSRMDVGGAVIPLGTTNGSTNAVMFGVALMAFRTPDLDVVPPKEPPPMVHHDMDAPPWWHFKKKERIYIDGFAEKGHRALMQFMLTPVNGSEVFRRREEGFRDVYAYLESLQAPKYPFDIDRQKAAMGKVAFQRVCAECHGTYAENDDEDTYPGVIVPIEDVQTDPARLHGLTRRQRAAYAKSWFGRHDRRPALTDPGGYMAPPLDGIWASAPYFHNGSVPTLWHVLHPKQRPTVWRRSENGYDQKKVGLEAQTLTEVPRHITDPHQRRSYFDTRMFGKSQQGHTFVDRLKEDEKESVLEYLKTL